MYGDRNTFQDARTTVTGFLDDFYDESEGNFNQALLSLERRLQDYFLYEPRDTENDAAGGDGGIRDKVIRIIKTMRGQALIDDTLGEKRCSFYLNDYAGQLAETVGYTEDGH